MCSSSRVDKVDALSFPNYSDGFISRKVRRRSRRPSAIAAQTYRFHTSPWRFIPGVVSFEVSVQNFSCFGQRTRVVSRMSSEKAHVLVWLLQHLQTQLVLNGIILIILSGNGMLAVGFFHPNGGKETPWKYHLSKLTMMIVMMITKRGNNRRL